MNRTLLQLLLVAAISLAAVALAIVTVSPRGAGSGGSVPVQTQPATVLGSTTLVSDPSGGLSPRDIQREAEQRSYRRQRRRIRIHGDVATVPATRSSLPAAKPSSQAGVSLVLVLVLVALLALPMVASRISARRSS
jgi:hypothetical protein